MDRGAWWATVRVVVQSLSLVRLFDSMDCSTQASLSLPISQTSLRLPSIELVRCGVAKKSNTA